MSCWDFEYYAHIFGFILHRKTTGAVYVPGQKGAYFMWKGVQIHLFLFSLAQTVMENVVKENTLSI